MPKVIIKPEKIKKEEYTFDASQYVLGRMAVKIAKILLGKNKAIYSPQWDLGDRVKVINAAQVKLTGKKEEQKTYIHHTTYPKGLRSRATKELRQRDPKTIIREAVWGMLPKGKLGHHIIKNLTVT